MPSSLTGVVRRNEVSDFFHQRAAKNSNSNKHSGRGSRGQGRYFDESIAGENKPLTDLFREGQVRSQNMEGTHLEYPVRFCCGSYLRGDRLLHLQRCEDKRLTVNKGCR